MTHYDYRSQLFENPTSISIWLSERVAEGWQLFGVYPSEFGYLVVMQRMTEPLINQVAGRSPVVVTE